MGKTFKANNERSFKYKKQKHKSNNTKIKEYTDYDTSEKYSNKIYRTR